LSAAKHFEVITGIEINKQAIEEATANAVTNEITNCEFKAASAENIFSVIQDFPRDTTAVVLDPPRKGCSEEFLEQLYEFAPRRIVYMSCDPTTQARDAAGIVAAGYKITSVQPFDIFPQTRHIECLIFLSGRIESWIFVLHQVDKKLSIGLQHNSFSLQLQ
jgi:tRNA (uracil-5-)-methyltransferase